MLATTGILSSYKSAGGFDADAQAFFTAAGITDGTQKSAINQLVLDLKSAGIWSKMKAIYPMVGGSASSHAVNLKTPGTYDLSFVGSPTHSGTGVDWNGSTQYAQTGLVPSTALTVNSSHISYYSRENSAVTGYPSAIACESTANNATPRLNIHMKSGDGSTYFDQYDDVTTRIATSAIARRDGFFLSTRTSSTSHKGFRNTTSYSNAATNSNSLPNQQMFIGAMNYRAAGGANFYESAECAWASIGDGLSDSEVSSLYTAVQTYQTTLGRQV